MAYLMYNKGADKIYLTSKQYEDLEEKACESLNLPYYPPPRIADDTKEYYDAKQKKLEWKIYYLTHILPQDKLNDIKHFNFLGEEAQREVYELLWAVRGCYELFELARKYYDKFYDIDMYVPSTVEYYLPNTFGKNFYIVKLNKEKRLTRTECWISSAYEIAVDKIEAIHGELSHFYIHFAGNEIIEIKETIIDSKRRDVRILHFEKNLTD